MTGKVRGHYYFLLGVCVCVCVSPQDPCSTAPHTPSSSEPIAGLGTASEGIAGTAPPANLEETKVVGEGRSVVMTTTLHTVTCGVGPVSRWIQYRQRPPSPPWA